MKTKLNTLSMIAMIGAKSLMGCSGQPEYLGNTFAPVNTGASVALYNCGARDSLPVAVGDELRIIDTGYSSSPNPQLNVYQQGDTFLIEKPSNVSLPELSWSRHGVVSGCSIKRVVNSGGRNTGQVTTQVYGTR